METVAAADMPALHRHSGERRRGFLTVWTIVLLISGQGFRHALGIPGYVVLCVVTVAAVAMMFRTPVRELKVPLLIGGFVGLAVLSTVWSATRTVTAAAAAVLVVTTYLAVMLVRGTDGPTFMVRLYRGLQISLFAGLLFEAYVALVVRHPVSPIFDDLSRLAHLDAHRDPIVWSEGNLLEGGPLQGFVGNRNPFGAIALFAVIVGVVMFAEGLINHIDGYVTVGAGVLVHLLTDSATISVSLVYISILVAGALAIRKARPAAKRPLSFGLLGGIAAAVVLNLKYREAIFGLFDRGADLTNRTVIWKQVAELAAQRPEGWGYVGYWPAWKEPYSLLSDGTGRMVPHAHNALLDAWLQLGLIGVVLLVLLMTLLFASGWRLIERAVPGDTFIPLGWVVLTAALVLQSLTESKLLVEGGWFLLVALYCSVPQVLRLTAVDPELVHTARQPEVVRGRAQVRMAQLFGRAEKPAT